MNIENINERLLRTERERDEARAEVEKIKAREAEGVALFDSLLARERAELARLRAAANERAIEELTTIVLGVSDIAYDYVGDGRGVRVPRGEVRDLIEQRIAALRAETPAPVPPPVTPPADAPSRPSVEALQYWTLLLRSRDLSESQCNAVLRLLLDDALAGRGEGAK